MIEISVLFIVKTEERPSFFLKTDGGVEDDVFFFTGSVPGLLIVSVRHRVRLFHIHGLIVNARMPRI